MTDPGLDRDTQKAMGAHYTPDDLARYLAQLSWSHLPDRPSLRVVDPSCGDGGLLLALAEAAPPGFRGRLDCVGIDQNADAVRRAGERLAQSATTGSAETTWEGITTDFLSLMTEVLVPQRLLFSRRANALSDQLSGAFDLVIANPPYVRTQVLGATESKRLRAALDLKGRVDLYHAFVNTMTRCLVDGGVLALLCSNRFLTTLSGESMRATLARGFRVERIVDLGDTRPFAAAVLPAIVIARRVRERPTVQQPTYLRIYQEATRTKDVALAAPRRRDSIFDALSEEKEGLYAVGESHYRVERGTLAPPTDGKEPWTLASPESREWLATILARTRFRFGEVADIRVGIKTTADAVFVRERWDDLPENVQPEAELIRPLIVHGRCARFRLKQEPAMTVLYPHETVDGQRRAVDLAKFPGAKAWLTRHRSRLEERAYLRDAGRGWYEIWVPQRPEDWSRPKLVFPDISERPRFALDESGAVVQGNCYWIVPTATAPPDILLLMLGVANSALALRFYDVACANRLYAGRRRFITQYVARFPLPDPASAASQAIVDRTRELLQLGPADDAGDATLDRRVSEAFGLHG